MNKTIKHNINGRRRNSNSKRKNSRRKGKEEEEEEKAVKPSRQVDLVVYLNLL
mgnify:CR=1 FL=1